MQLVVVVINDKRVDTAIVAAVGYVVICVEMEIRAAYLEQAAETSVLGLIVTAC